MADVSPNREPVQDSSHPNPFAAWLERDGGVIKKAPFSFFGFIVFGCVLTTILFETILIPGKEADIQHDKTVSDGANSALTSKQSDFEAQLNDLKNQLNTANDSAGAIKTQLSAANNVNNVLNSKYADLQNQLKELRVQLTILNNTLAQVKQSSGLSAEQKQIIQNIGDQLSMLDERLNNESR